MKYFFPALLLCAFSAFAQQPLPKQEQKQKETKPAEQKPDGRPPRPTQLEDRQNPTLADVNTEIQVDRRVIVMMAALNVAGLARFEKAAAVGALNISGSPAAPVGTVDVGANGLVVSGSIDGASAATNAALANVRNLILVGAQHANAGPGIVSSAAQSDARLAVGYARAADLFQGHGGTFLGQSVDPDAILVRTTLAGDADLDGWVDFNDLVALAQNYNTRVADNTDSWWTHGDVTYDGVVDFNDLVKLAQNYNTALTPAPIPGASAAFDADLARAFASVPEPSQMVLLLIATAAWAGRRRSGDQRGGHTAV